MNLRKWNSNSAELLTQIKETTPCPATLIVSTNLTEEDEGSYAKATTGHSLTVQESNMVKLLGTYSVLEYFNGLFYV